MGEYEEDEDGNIIGKVGSMVPMKSHGEFAQDDNGAKMQPVQSKKSEQRHSAQAPPAPGKADSNVDAPSATLTADRTRAILVALHDMVDIANELHILDENHALGTVRRPKEYKLAQSAD